MGRSTAVTCGICGKQIGRKADLKRHMILHVENKEELKHSCPYSGCTFKTLQKSNLDCHINKHTGLRPYKCFTAGCGFRTSDRASLTRHRKEIHEHVPRRRAKTHTADASTAANLSSIPGGPLSPVEAFPDRYQTPRPGLLHMLEPRPLLVPPTDCCINSNESKSDPVAFRTDVFMEYPWVNNEQYSVVNTEAAASSSSSSLLASGLLMSEEIPMLNHTQVSATIYDASLPSIPLPPNAVDNTLVSSAGLYVDDYNYMIYDTPIASGSQFVGDYYLATSILSGCDSTLNNAGSFDAQPFGDYSFAAFEMGVHHQDVDQMYSHAAPAWSGGHPMQGLMYPDDQSLLILALGNCGAS